MPIRITGMNSGLDTESIISELVSAYRQKGEKYEKEQTTISWKQEAWKSLSSQTFSFRKSLDSLRFTSGYSLKKTTVSNSAKASVTAGNNAVIGTQTLEIKTLAKSGYLTGGRVKSLTGENAVSGTSLSMLGMSGSGDFSVNGKRISVDSSMSVSDVITKLQDAGVNANFDAANQRIFVSSKESGAAGDFSIIALNTNGADALKALGLNVKPADGTMNYQQYADTYGTMDLQQLGAVLSGYSTGAAGADKIIASYAKEYQAAGDEVTKNEIAQEFQQFIEFAKESKDKTAEQMGYNSDAVRIYGQDARIILNGAEFTSKSNSFSINGLTIDAMGVTEDGEVLSVTTTTDNQGIYDKIKDFFADYNDLINTMTKSYNAESSKDYEPLTEDEKAEMSEKEIEKWEEKAKSGLLRRDSTLSTLMSVLTSAMSKTYEVNGKKYSLSSFGIMTLGITDSEKNEQNAYHIDGDADDEDTSSNTDKLMAAIISDPDGVAEFFKQLSTELYNNLGEQMTSTTLRSYGSFYNDKEMDTQYNSYTTKISDWEEKVQEIEDRYYKKFAAMESALASLNSQQSSLAGLLGS